MVIGHGWTARDSAVAQSPKVDAEAKSLVLLRLDVLGEDIEGAEDWEVDIANVRAGAGNDEILVQGREGKLDGAASDEGQLGWDQVHFLEEAVEAVLLALLSNDGGNAGNQSLVTGVSFGEVDLNVLKSAKDNIGEQCSRLDGFLEGSGPKLIPAGQNRGLALALEKSGGENGVEFFLSLDRSEGFQDVVALILVVDFKARNVVGDVIDQAREEEDLEVLVEVDQLDAGDAQVADGTVWRRATVGKRAMGSGLDVSERLSAEGREAVG